MGECTYYFKAQFKSDTAAKKALPKIQKFLLENLKAQDFWQANRGESPTQEVFWEQFKEKFPITTAYLKSFNMLDGEKNNGLAGRLDLCSYPENVEYIQLDGSVIGYTANDVWHFADWSPLAEFLKTQFGAIKVAISSEENGCGSLDSLQLFDYRGIVECLVKRAKSEAKKGKTELFNAITGTHTDLNYLLNL